MTPAARRGGGVAEAPPAEPVVLFLYFVKPGPQPQPHGGRGDRTAAGMASPREWGSCRAVPAAMPAHASRWPWDRLFRFKA